MKTHFLRQPSINYNFPGGLYLSSAPIITADWKAERDKDTWTVPLGGGVGKLWGMGIHLSRDGLQVNRRGISLGAPASCR